MGTLKIVTGKYGSGKSAWIDKWVDEDPDSRARSPHLADAIKQLAAGKDVAMEIGLGEHGIEVVTVA